MVKFAYYFVFSFFFIFFSCIFSISSLSAHEAFSEIENIKALALSMSSRKSSAPEFSKELQNRWRRGDTRTWGCRCKGRKVKKLIAIQVNPIALTYPINIPLQFSALGIYKDLSTRDLTQAVKWRSSCKNIASFKKSHKNKGLVECKNAGQTTISAALKGIKGSTLLTATDAAINSIQIDPANPVLAEATKNQLKAFAIFTDGSYAEVTDFVQWHSTTPEVVSVSNRNKKEGVIQGNATGNATVVATFQNMTDAIDVQIPAARLITIDVSPVSTSIPVGFTQQYTATGIYQVNETEEIFKVDLTNQVEWASRQRYASIDSTGLATALSGGVTTITAAFENKLGIAILNVPQDISLTSIQVFSSNLSIAAGFYTAYTAIGSFNDGTLKKLSSSEVLWKSSNENVVQISNDETNFGIAYALSEGTASILASSKIGKVFDSTELTVTAGLLQNLRIVPESDGNVSENFGFQFTALGDFSDGTKNVTSQVAWQSSDTGILKITNEPPNNGLALGIAPGSVTITASLFDNTITFLAATEFEVTPKFLKSIMVTPVFETLPIGGIQQYKAVGTFNDGSIADITNEVVWISSDETTASISNAEGTQGLASGLRSGSVRITATPQLQSIRGNAILDVE